MPPSESSSRTVCFKTKISFVRLSVDEKNEKSFVFILTSDYRVNDLAIFTTKWVILAACYMIPISELEKGFRSFVFILTFDSRMDDLTIFRESAIESVCVCLYCYDACLSYLLLWKYSPGRIYDIIWKLNSNSLFQNTKSASYDC